MYLMERYIAYNLQKLLPWNYLKPLKVMEFANYTKFVPRKNLEKIIFSLLQIFRYLHFVSNGHVQISVWKLFSVTFLIDFPTQVFYAFLGNLPSCLDFDLIRKLF